MAGQKTWYVYLLRCADHSLYAGVALDPRTREAQHNGETGSGRGARYTRARRPVRLVYIESCRDRADACRREAEIKRLNKAEKEAMVAAVGAAPDADAAPISS